MAELPNVKLISGGKKNNQKTNRTILKKANAKPSKKPVETVLPKIPTEVGNLVPELKPKILKTSQTKKVVKKSKNSEAVTKKLVPRTLAATKQILQSVPKTQESKQDIISTIPVHKKVETNKVEVKKKMDVKKMEIKSVKVKTVQPKSTSKPTKKSGSTKEEEELRPLKTDDLKQTVVKNKQLQIKGKRVLKKKLNSLSGGGKTVIPKTPDVKNERPVGKTSARTVTRLHDADIVHK